MLPTRPRESTEAPAFGSTLSIAYTRGAASPTRNTATWRPFNNAHTPVSGTMSVKGQMATQLSALAPDSSFIAFMAQASTARMGITLLRRSIGVAGRIWPRSSTNTTFSSFFSLLTKWRKRWRTAGSVTAAFHSQA